MEKKEENENTKKDENKNIKIEENNNTSIQENNAIDKSENNNNKETKEINKGKGKKFLQKIKAKFNDLSNEVNEKILNLKKDMTIKKKEEKKYELKEIDSNKEKNNENRKETKNEKEEIDYNNEEKSKEKNKSDVLNAEKSSEKRDEQPPSSGQNSASTITPPQTNSCEKEEEKKEEFTKDELKKIYFRFHSIIIENKKYETFISELSSIFETLAEYLIYGDKNDQSLIDLFISLNYLFDIFTLMRKKNRNINIQIIKFFSVLMTNLSEKNFNYFLYNCDFINQVIYEDPQIIEGDYLYYYINFIKALLFKINKDNINIFFHEDLYTFPLLVNCLKFYNHPDNMISNTIRNIFLSILKMGYKPCIDYICTLPMISYFAFISCRLRDEIKTLNKKIKRNKSEASTILHERICNGILYFQDIFGINIEKINYILINCIFHFIILPTLLNSLIIEPEKIKKNNVMETFSHIGNDMSVFDFTKNLIKDLKDNNKSLIQDCISKELAMYILNLFIKYIKNETFLNALLSILFLPKIHYKIIAKINTPVKDLFNYKGDYDTKNKNKINLERSIIENYTPNYMKGLIKNPHKIFAELIKIEKKIDEKCKIAKIANDLNTSTTYKFYMEIINDYFSRSGLKECKEYHQIMSEATGIQCGLSFHDDRKSVLYLLNKNLKYIYEKNNNKYVGNIISGNFLEQFKSCKFLYLLLMYNYLFNQILQNKSISKELLAYIELLNPNEIYKNQSNNIAKENDPILHEGDLLSNSKKEPKEKTKKIKDINFSNINKVMYNTDFVLNEFNLYDNTILSKYFYNGQKEYNITILHVILNYLNRDDVLRPEIYLFLIKLINDLILCDIDNKKFLLKLNENHITIIKNIFVKNVEKIISIINKDKIEENDLIKIFEFFWKNKENEKKNYYEEYEIMIQDFMEDCLFLLNNKVEDKNNTYSDKLELYNSLNIANLELKIRCYLIKLFLDLYDGVYNGKIKEIKLEDLNEENKSKIKEIIVNNFNKLIFKEETKEKNE